MHGSVGWRSAGVVVAIAAAAALRWVSAAEVPGAPASAALVRLSFGARPELLEQCRRLSDAELAERPAHMRLRLECTGTFARYLLGVSLNGVGLASDTVRGGGLRHDRPLHVFREYPAPVGPLRLRVELTRLDSAHTDVPVAADVPTADAADTILATRATREVDERRRRAGEAIPPRLVLDTLLPLAPRRVILVTYDGVRRRLEARTGR